MEITKLSVREKLVVDVSVWMNNPEDYDFSPRASLVGSTISLFNGNEETPSATVDLDDEQAMVAERDRMVELRVKFSVAVSYTHLTLPTSDLV